MAVDISGTSVEFGLQSIGGTWSWKVRANNIRSAGQLYEVIDVTTPYGLLTSAMIPLPGDVVTEMANSIVAVQQQFAPLMTLAPLSQTSFSLIITEGDPNSEIGQVSVLNSGAFGSFMTVIATPGAAWLSASPTSIQNIGKNEQATFGLTLVTSTLLSSGSPYSGVVSLQDNRTPPTVIPITTSVTVLPRPIISPVPTTVSLTFISSTSSPGGSQQVVISNSGPVNSSLEFTLAKVNGNSDWLSFIPTSGGPLAPSQSSIITFSVVASAASRLPPGVYMESVRISSMNASNSPVDISVNLTVLP